MRGLLLTLLLTGCPQPGVKLEPIPPSEPSTRIVAEASAAVESSGAAIGGATLTLRVFRDGTSERISNAEVAVIGPTLGYGTTGIGTDLQFDPLEAGVYRVRLRAPGYTTRVEGNIRLDPKQAIALDLKMVPQGGTVSGRVLAAEGPLSGARIRMGEAWALSDANGAFTVTGVAAGVGTLSVRKTGYQGHSRAVDVSGEVSIGDLTLSAGSNAVSLENPGDSFGTQTVSQALTPVKGLGVTVSDQDSGAGTRIIASPSSLSDAVIEANRQWVAAGGKLILMGEWGGYSGYSPGALSKQARVFGLSFNPDLARSGKNLGRPEWILAEPNGSLATGQGVASVAMFEGCTLFAGPQTVTLASTGGSGYRVQSMKLSGDLPVASAVVYEEGLVVALGDTSAWVQPGTQGGSSNLDAAGNRQFMLNLLRW